MKRLFVLPTLLLILALSIVPAGAQGAKADPPPGQLHYYDVQLDVMLPRLANFQAQYHSVNGRYYQALESHSSIPEDVTIPQNLHAHPTDQIEDLAYFWDTVAELPGNLAWSFRVDTYNGPFGEGYALTVTTLIQGEIWQRSVNYGPAEEDWRVSDWHLVTPFEF